MKRFQGTSTGGRSCLIGQIPAKSFLHKSHHVISLRACFPTEYLVLKALLFRFNFYKVGSDAFDNAVLVRDDAALLCYNLF